MEVLSRPMEFAGGGIEEPSSGTAEKAFLRKASFRFCLFKFVYVHYGTYEKRISRPTPRSAEVELDFDPLMPFLTRRIKGFRRVFLDS